MVEACEESRSSIVWSTYILDREWNVKVLCFGVGDAICRTKIKIFVTFKRPDASSGAVEGNIRRVVSRYDNTRAC